MGGKVSPDNKASFWGGKRKAEGEASPKAKKVKSEASPSDTKRAPATKKGPKESPAKKQAAAASADAPKKTSKRPSPPKAVKAPPPARKASPPKSSSKTPRSRSAKKENRNETPGSGQWTDAEHQQFEWGVVVHGWGRWKEIEAMLQTRTRFQIKSHAQKFMVHQPDAKVRLEKEHADYVGHHYGGSRKSPPVPPAARRLPLSKNKTPKPSVREEEWSSIEKKQFEDGCVFHGWGNWTEISDHIITKDKSEVAAYAAAYSPKEKKRLKREHALNYEGEEEHGSGPVEEMPSLPGADKPKKKKKKKNSGHKTTVADVGAAEAIMALNFANWHPEGDEEEESDETESSEDEDVKKESSVPTKSDEAGSEEPSASAGYDYADGATANEDGKGEVAVVQPAPIQPAPAGRNNQPPPNWLAVDSWDQCLANINRWNVELTEEERNAAYAEYNSLNPDEKERLRNKLVILMSNRPRGT